MKKTILAFVSCCLLGVHADFVYRYGSSFSTTADMDGDGRSDLVLVDGSNATVRVGYQLSANTITWSAPRSLGLDEVFDIACGTVRTNANDLLVVCAPELNRFVFYDLATATQPPVPEAGYGTATGPGSIAVLEISGGGYEDLLAVSEMNGSSPFRAERLASTGTTLASLGLSTVGSLWQHLNNVEYLSGVDGLAVIDSLSGGYLRIYDPDATGLGHVGSKSLSGAANSAFVSFFSWETGYAEFVVWEEGDDSIKTFAWTGATYSSTTSYTLGSQISAIYMVQGNGTTHLAVVFNDGERAEIFDYDGSGPPVSLQTIYPPVGERLAGFLPLNALDFVALSSVSGDLAAAVSAEQHHYNGLTFDSVGTQSLPALGNGGASANVMTFAGEPFVDNTPKRLQLLHAAGWSSGSAIAGTVSANVETDSGPEYGLGNLRAVSLGTPDGSAAYTLDNQPHDAISLYSFDAARGEEVLSLFIYPEAGTYGTSIEVALSSSPPATAIYYRTDPSSAWATYAAPFALFADADVQYYAKVGNKSSIIRTASYRFSDTPSTLDSDGDGVPDYVEIANGLDPLESGLDADGDGFSDLDELLAGTDPANDADFPATRMEQGSVYSLAVSPLSIDGPPWNDSERSAIGTQLRLFNASGGLVGYAKTTNHVLSVSVPNPSALFEAVPLSQEPPFVAALTDPRFDLLNRGVDNQHGVEMVGIYLLPTSGVGEVAYAYQGGDLAAEANAWLEAALDLYTNQTRTVQGAGLEAEDVVAAVLVERKLADLLVERGTLTNGWVSLFKGRVADKTMAGFRASSLLSLEHLGADGEAAYDLRELVSSINAAASSLSLKSIAEDLYAMCSGLGLDTNSIGQYPLPIDVLREFVYTGNMQSNYQAEAGWSDADLLSAYTQATQALAQVASRTVESLMLNVHADSFDAACPVLYTGLGAAKSLYTASGNPFRFPVTFTLQPGAKVTVEAYTDVTWDQCPGTDPLEVISLALTAVPVASGTDADGNLIPDDYEALFLAGSGGLATSDLDGDGYSDLQEYLDQTDPDNVASHGAIPVDLSPPFIWIQSSDLSIDWPPAYADAFVFTVELTGDLAGTPFAEDQELPSGALDATLDLSADQRFYRVKMRLR